MKTWIGQNRATLVASSSSVRPGLGKTRLADEFSLNAALAGIRVERISTQPHDAFRPTFADLIPQLLRLPGALGCSPQSMAALKRLTTHESGEPSPNFSTEASDIRSSAIARAIADLVDAITGESPLIILIDDLQWADELSRTTLAALVAGRLRRRLLIVLTSRDRGLAEFFGRRHGKIDTSAFRRSRQTQKLTELIDRVLQREQPARRR